MFMIEDLHQQQLRKTSETVLQAGSFEIAFQMSQQEVDDLVTSQSPAKYIKEKLEKAQIESGIPFDSATTVFMIVQELERLAEATQAQSSASAEMNVLLNHSATYDDNIRALATILHQVGFSEESVSEGVESLFTKKSVRRDYIDWSLKLIKEVYGQT